MHQGHQCNITIKNDRISKTGSPWIFNGCTRFGLWYVREGVEEAAVRVFSTLAAVVKHDISIIDIIAEAPPAESKAVLAFSLPDACEFPDAVLATPVIQISAEDGDGVRVHCGELGVSSGEGAQESLKSRGSTYRKRRRHAF